MVEWASRRFHNTTVFMSVTAEVLAALDAHTTTLSPDSKYSQSPSNSVGNRPY